ncbi:hypothetical protein [Christiangramia aquimixticola]|uniref:hypothetical protein n=1 Tax=Christiangramia aquimixticola TaxID=1697558 RepID=UPI003AA83BD2
MKIRAVYVFIILHLTFIGVALYENSGDYFKTAFLTIISGVLSYFYLRSGHKNRIAFKWQGFSEILFCIAGGVLTYFLQIKYNLSAVLAAALIGLAGSFIPDLDRNRDFLKKLSPAVYCGAFVGMTSSYFASYTFVILAATVAGVLLIMSKNTLLGMGGKLGSVAFGGVVLVSTILYLL